MCVCVCVCVCEGNCWSNAPRWWCVTSLVASRMVPNAPVWTPCRTLEIYSSHWKCIHWILLGLPGSGCRVNVARKSPSFAQRIRMCVPRVTASSQYKVAEKPEHRQIQKPRKTHTHTQTYLCFFAMVGRRGGHRRCGWVSCYPHTYRFVET